MSALFIDTETNGLPNLKNMSWGEYPDYKKSKNYDTARIIQLSFIVTDVDFNMTEIQDYTIKREGFSIENHSFHGITNEISDDGVDFTEAIDNLFECLKKTTHIITHNIAFDINVILSELFRRKRFDIIKEIKKKELLCTMRHCKNIVKIINKYGKNKNPSLNELYVYCFKENIEKAHDAKYDVLNLHKVIKKMYDDDILEYKLVVKK
jgi:DNA polymerase-3 subunit alpha